MTDKKDLLVAELNIKAVFPVLKVLLQDDPKTKAKFKDVDANVVFRAKHEDGFVGANLIFKNGDLVVEPQPVDEGDVIFTFGTVPKMNTFLKGGIALPAIKGFTNFKLLTSFITTLLKLKLMMPNVRPKDDHNRYLKVKLALYMVSTALSKLNKSGHKEMNAWTSKQPDRIYQLSVIDTDIAVYLRVKAGKTKAGRGLYKRKRPFVHMKFDSVDGALKVLLKDAPFVEAVDKKYVTIEGSPEYANNLNDFMMIVQSLIA
jgi:hypothetical protein